MPRQLERHRAGYHVKSEQKICAAGEVCQKHFNKHFFRMIEVAKHYPYFNDDAETKWKGNNLNQKIENDMKNAARCTKKGLLKVGKMDAYKVHDIMFVQERGSSLPTVNCPPHTAAKEM